MRERHSLVVAVSTAHIRQRTTKDRPVDCAFGEYRRLVCKGRAGHRRHAASLARALGPAILRVVDAQEPPLRVFFGGARFAIARTLCGQRLKTRKALENGSTMQGMGKAQARVTGVAALSADWSLSIAVVDRGLVRALSLKSSDLPSVGVRPGGDYVRHPKDRTAIRTRRDNAAVSVQASNDLIRSASSGVAGL
jgi:hypothetical protein